MIRKEVFLLSGITLAHSLSHAFIIAFPVLIPFISKEFYITYTQMGYFALIFFVTYGLTTFPSGWITDTIGIKRVMIIYLTLLAISSVLLIFVNSFFTLLILAIGIGLIAGFYHPPGLSLISLSFSSEDLGKMFGVHGISGNLGSAIAPGLAVLVASSQYGWKYALIPLGVLAIIAIPFFLIISIPNPNDSNLKPDAEPLELQSIKSQNKNGPPIYIRPLLLILVLSFLVGLVDRGMLAFLPTYLVDDRLYSPVVAGLFVTISFAVAIAGQIGFGMLSDSKGAVMAFRVTALSITILCFLIPFIPGIMILAILILVQFSLTGTQPPLSIMTTSVSSEEKRGTVFGLQFISVFGFGGLGGFLAGIIAASYGLDAIFFVLGALSIPVFIVLLFYPKWAPPNLNTPDINET